MSRLIECVPNVSEGRRGGVLRLLADALATSPGVTLLHVHPDVDHNRTVYTLVGPPHALLDALTGLYSVAVAHVDLRQHRGVHPRIGAVDVCPFVPLPRHGSTIEDAVDVARRLGARVGERIGLPVYLYRAAATEPGRVDLSSVRRGQFEGLEERMRDPAWRPDYGPTTPHPTAGATAIGARQALIAYNVVLASGDLTVARAVARRVRASSGGLAGVKAMGVALSSRSLVQVSMNIEDPETTPLHVAVDAVRAAAAELNTEVLETELVGLVPSASVTAAAAHHLQLPQLPVDRVLENAIHGLALGPGG